MNNLQQNITEFVQANNLRKNLATLILIFIALFLIAKTVLTYKQAVSYKDNSTINYISVSGKAEKYTVPDTLTFNITISEEGKDVSEVTIKAKAKADKAIAILIANGVEKENIKLENYNVSDKYENISQPCAYPQNVKMMTAVSYPCPTNSKIVGQILTQTMMVKVRDIEKNADNVKRTKIISELSAENIKVDGFNFTVYDMEAVQKEIRDEAIKNAKEDAKKLARSLGVRLNELSSFSDNTQPAYPLNGGTTYDTMSVKSARSNMVPVAPELTPGQEKITSNVTLTYSTK